MPFASDFRRAYYHWEQLRRLDYVESRDFVVGEWADRDHFKAFNDYPFSSENVSDAEAEVLRGAVFEFHNADGGWVHFTGWRPPFSELASKYRPILRVGDRKDRMPQWEAFVARHNAEDAAARLVGQRGNIP